MSGIAKQIGGAYSFPKPARTTARNSRVTRSVVTLSRSIIVRSRLGLESVDNDHVVYYSDDDSLILIYYALQLIIHHSRPLTYELPIDSSFVYHVVLMRESASPETLTQQCTYSESCATTCSDSTSFLGTDIQRTFVWESYSTSDRRSSSKRCLPSDTPERAPALKLSKVDR